MWDVLRVSHRFVPSANPVFALQLAVENGWGGRNAAKNRDELFKNVVKMFKEQGSKSCADSEQHNADRIARCCSQYAVR